MYLYLCKSHKDEEVATLLFSSYIRLYACLSLRKSSSDGEVGSSPVLSGSTYIYIQFSLCVSLVAMRKWLPCSSLVLYVLYLSIFLCVSLVVMDKESPCSSLVLYVFSVVAMKIELKTDAS